MVTWTRVERKGFVASHWHAQTGRGSFSIWWRRDGSRTRKSVSFALVGPDGLRHQYNTVKEAKAAVAKIVESDNAHA